MILMDDIIIEGHPTLNKKAQDVAVPLSNNDKKILKDMLEYVHNSVDPELSKKYDLRAAVGISAPQINISKRMFVVSFYNFDSILYEYALINPTMEVLDDKIIYLPGGEGCLSVERVTEGLTPRYSKVLIKGLRYDFQANILVPIEMVLSGYEGIVFQHEFDHLEGVLFTEKLFDTLENATPAFLIEDDV